MTHFLSAPLLGTAYAMSFELFGSYIPAWVACLLAGLLAATLTHLILRQVSMLNTMPLLPVFYLLVSIFAGMTSWLIFFSAG